MPTVEDVVAVAERYVGMVENPPGSNRTPLVARLDVEYGRVQLANGSWIFRDGQEWCASANAAWFHEAAGWPEVWGLPIVSFYTPSDRNTWRSLGLWFKDGQPGDHIYFDWNNDGTVDHVGLVAEDLGDAWRTIEGNLGNRVQEVVRPKGRNIAGFGRPPYAEPQEATVVPVLLRDPNRLAVYCGLPAHSRTWVQDEAQLARIKAAYPSIGDVVLMSIADQRVLFGPRLGPLPEQFGYPSEAE